MRIVLVHATELSIAPVRSAFARFWPDAETTSILEEALSVDRAKEHNISPAIYNRIERLTEYAVLTNPHGILFTCSAFGPAIDAARRNRSIPILKPNEAMFSQSLRLGRRIALVTTFPASIVTMEQEFNIAAKEHDKDMQLVPHFVSGAMNALAMGDHLRHNELIAQCVAGIQNVDAIMLGQFSMENALELCRKVTNIPILSAPECAVRAMRAVLMAN